MTYWWIVPIVMFVLLVLVRILSYPEKCPKCGTDMRHWTIDDTMEHFDLDDHVTGHICPNGCWCRVHVSMAL